MKVQKLIRSLRTLADELEAELEQSEPAPAPAAPAAAAPAANQAQEMLTINADGSAKWEPFQPGA